MDIAVREFAPIIDKNRTLPLWPKRVHVRYVAPLYLAWEGMKASTRVPGVVASRFSDLTWLQRELLPGYPTLEALLGRPVVFDVDDAIWIARPFGPASIADIARRSAVVLAGNSYIAEWFGQHAEDVRVVPTAIDTERFCAGCGSQDGGTSSFIVGWTGTAANLPYLESIVPALRRFMTDHPDVYLKVIADRPPSFTVPGGRLRFVRWTPEIEATALRDLHVGVMPLPDTEWTRGKCSFKLLQYMATGIAVIASPVGMNRDVLSMGEVGAAASTTREWQDALEAAYQDRALCRRWGANGRRVAERGFDRRVIAASLAGIFREVA